MATYGYNTKKGRQGRGRTESKKSKIQRTGKLAGYNVNKSLYR